MDNSATNQPPATKQSSLERRLGHLSGSVPTGRSQAARIDWIHDAARHPMLARIGSGSDD